MPFSLRKLVKGAYDDVNVFDGGKSHGNPTPQAAAPPPPASTARPQGSSLSVQPVRRPMLDQAPAPPILPKLNPQVQVAAPKPLTVGDTTVAPDPTARTGVAPAPIQPSFLDKAKAFDMAAGSSIYKGIGELAGSPDLLRSLTPNFIPGVSSHIDPAIKKVSDTLTSPFAATARNIDTIAERKGLYDNPTTPFVPDTTGLDAAKRYGNITGTGTTFVATGGLQAARDAVLAAKAAPGVIRAIPEVAPKALDAGRQIVAHTTGLVDPKFAGLPKNQVIMDTQKLDILRNALNPSDDVNARQQLIDGLHQINNDHGLDFISGSPADRKMRISQYLEQNGEAIPELQKWMDRPQLSGNEIGAVGRDVRNDAEDPMTPIGDVLANKQAELEARRGAPVADAAAKPKPTPTTKLVTNKLTKGAQDERQNLSPELGAAVQGEHVRRNTQQLADEASAAADAAGLDKTMEAAHSALAVKTGEIDDKTVALAHQAIERADAAGKLDDAVGIHDALSEHLLKQGQSIQAASLFYKLSPRGMLFKGIRDLKKAGKEVDPELQTRLSGLADKIAAAPDGEAKQMAVAEFKKLVADNIPKSKSQDLLAIWKAGLLSGVKTQTGNALSNGTFGALKGFSNPVAAGVDRVLSLVTKERTKTATLRGVASGSAKGAKKGLNTLKSGIDERNISADKYELHGELNFKNPIINKIVAGPTNLVFRGMSAADQPFYYAAFKNTLYDQAKAEGMTKGLRGKELRGFMNKMADAPTDAMANVAKSAAEKAVLGQDNRFSSYISQGAQKWPIIGAVVPFTKVPTNFLLRTLDYTPVGATKAIVKGLANKAGKGKGVTQRELAEAIGESTTGTGLIYLGAELANNKLLSGDYPSSDPKEQQRWKAEGITPNSVKIGNQWVSLNYLGPVGLLFGAGKDYQDAAAKGDNATMAAITGTGQNLTGQSFLTGLNNFANALNDPQRYMDSLVNQYSGSTVPNLVNDAANLGDDNQREVNGPVDAIKGRVPAVRNTLPVKQDVYGDELKQRTDKVNLLTNPLRPSNAITNDVKGEVARLHNVDVNNKDLQVTPTTIDKKITVSGQSIKLTPEQRHDLQKQVGQATQQNWDKLIKMPEYQAMSDGDKANALNKLRQATADDKQREYVVGNNLGTYDKHASAATVRASQGKLSSFVQPHGSGGGSFTEINEVTDPHSKKVLNEYNILTSDERKKKAYGEDSYDYKVAQAKYDNDIANGSLSKAQQIKRMDSLKKDKVGADHSKETREYFALNKDDLANLVENDSDGKAIAEKVIAYDQALTAAGVQAKNKFKNGIIAASGSGGGSGGSSSGKAALSDFITRSKATTDLGTKNQGELADLIQNSKVTPKGGNSKKATVVGVTLKKQKQSKKQKVKVA